MTLSEILPHNSSFIAPMQLVMLCMESYYQFFFFLNRKFSPPLLKTYKTLSNLVFKDRTDCKLKGVVIAIAGDNLGLHSLGGFPENFSKSKNFCRYCIISRDKFENEPTKLGPARVVESYKNRVAKLSMGSKNCVDGVKKRLITNHFQIITAFLCMPTRTSSMSWS